MTREWGPAAVLTAVWGLAAAAILWVHVMPVEAVIPAERPAPPECPMFLEPVVLTADVLLLARVAASEDPTAAAAVMWTVINRAQNSSRALTSVATPGAYHGLRYPPRDTHLDRLMLRRLEFLAAEVLAGRVPDPTGGATHFHRVGTPTPAWAPSPAEWQRFGQHVFYREKSGRDRAASVYSRQEVRS